MVEVESPDEPRLRCPNCEAEGLGRWCHECGQDNRRERLDTRSILHDGLETLTDGW